MDAETGARVARRAHELWLQQGRPNGRADEHWRQAEAEIAPGGAAGARTSGKMPADVQAAFDNAVLLHTFALERGQDVGDDVTKTLAETRLELEQPSWTAAKETAFWQSYRKLNSVLSPITTEAVKAIRPEERRSTRLTRLFETLGLNVFRSQSLATIATRRYRVWGVVALVLVLFLQVYYAMGSALLTDFQELGGSPFREASILVENAKSAPADSVVQEGQAAAPTSSAVPARAGPIPVELAMAAKLDTIETLNNLNLVWLVLAPEVTDPFYKDVLSYGYLKLALDAIANYFLPLLYGLLGACAYIIRTVSVEIQRVMYSQETHTRFELRLFLGALAGLSVVWFIQPDDPKITIPTVALAFLAGYSVELVFVAMDRLVAAFGGEPDSRRVSMAPEVAGTAAGQSSKKSA